MKYNNVYWSKGALDLDTTTADILAIGDSWFWYPMPGGSLINRIGDLVARMDHNILVAGNNGAEAYDYVKGKYKRQVSELLRLYGPSASALLISGGGNDFAGLNDLRPMLKPDCGGCTSAAGCFVPGDDEGTIEWLMHRVYENHALLISRALYVMPPTGHIVLHAYDYAIPDGRGVFGGGGWLKPALDVAQVPPELQAGCIRVLVDYAFSVFQRLAAGAPGRISVVDSRGTLTAADWANELHPSPGGFKKFAEQRWQPVLHNLGLC
jgi:hypothetical protein